MKHLLYTALLLFACSCTKNNNGDIVINFKVQNVTSPRVTIANMESSQIMDLDKNGVAVCVLKGDNIYTNLVYGDAIKELFFQKGDRATITFDATKFRNSFQFEGKNTPIIEYINSFTYQPINPPEFNCTWDEMISLINKNIDEATSILEAQKLEEINPEFVSLEKERIKYTYVVYMILYPMSRMQDTTYTPGDDYYAALEKYMVDDERLLHIPAYREYVMEAALVLATRNQNASDLYDRTIVKMNYITQHFKNDSIIQSFVTELAVSYIQRRGINNISEMESIVNNYIKYPDLLAAYKAEYDKHIK